MQIHWKFHNRRRGNGGYSGQISLFFPNPKIPKSQFSLFWPTNFRGNVQLPLKSVNCRKWQKKSIFPYFLGIFFFQRELISSLFPCFVSKAYLFTPTVYKGARCQFRLNEVCITDDILNK